MQDWILGYLKKTAMADLKYCAAASSATVCTTCLDTADKVGAVCVLKKTNMRYNGKYGLFVATCEDGYYKVGDVCTGTCNAGCICTLATECTTCKAGYFVAGDKLSCKTVENCATMESATECTTCKAGYFVAGDKLSCKTVDNCETMESATECTTCKAGYFVCGW